MKIRVKLNEAGIAELIKALNDYKRWLEECSAKLVERLASEGFQIARAGFARAEYDGTNDANVMIETRDDRLKAIVAVGASVLFIEFGTGVVYPDIHPEASENGMKRGRYGQGKGAQDTWGYYGDPGTHGEVIKTSSKGQLVLTHGNPANMPMYQAAKELADVLPGLVREVFSHD